MLDLVMHGALPFFAHGRRHRGAFDAGSLVEALETL